MKSRRVVYFIIYHGFFSGFINYLMEHEQVQEEPESETGTGSDLEERDPGDQPQPSSAYSSSLQKKIRA